MFDKILAWCGNVLMASVLVLLVAQQSVFAQSNDTSAEKIIGGPNGGNEPGRIVVPLTGTATTTSITGLKVTPASFDTGVVEIGLSVDQKVTITHTGSVDSDPIAINDAELFGKSTSEYTIDFNGFITLNPGDEVDINIVFTPVVPGTKSAGLRMDVEGATAPYVLLFNGWSRYPLTSDLSVSDTSVKFGQVVENGSTTKTFVLANEGEPEAPVITVSSIKLSGDTPQAFKLVGFKPVTLSAGKSVTVKVQMGSANSGFKSADVLVEHDGNNPALEFLLSGSVVKPQSVPVAFGKSVLKNITLARATSLQFGPDGNLYVAEMDGTIKIFSVTRNGKNNYSGTQVDAISLIKNVQNYDDDGSVNNGLNTRLVTGLLVTGTAGSPVIYAASSDPRQAAGPSGTDSNLDTNSGILHKLTKSGGSWSKQDMVRGLPRSEENHAPNGLTLYGNKLLLVTGGHTNMGAPSNNFAELPEYALSGAILEIDINAIGNGTHDLPTLDDEDRAGTNDENDPFGGNDGKNQAKLMNSGPVKLFSTGYRNAYDILVTEAGKIYTFDNGPNSGWGGAPAGDCMNTINNGGATHYDNLHLITKNSYGGHPNPTRGNKDNTFNSSNPQSPIEGSARPQDCTYKQPGSGDGALNIIGASSNGLDEYTASNFLGAMKGDLLVASFNKVIYRLQLNGAGTGVTSKSALATGIGNVPLDLTTQGDSDEFPGTIWVADHFDANTITIFEPSDY